MAVPTGVSVTNLGDYWPTFNATRTAESGKLFSMQWDIASDAAFTTVLYTINNTAQSASAGAVTQAFSNASRTAVIPAGTYYVRARQMENGVTPHAYSGTVTITSTVQPPAFSAQNINSPAGNVGSNQPVLSVDFLGDQSMSNYQRQLIPVIELAAAADFSGTKYVNDVGTDLKYAPTPVRVGFLGTAGSTIPSGTYHVRMRARDETGAYSSYVAGADAVLVVSATGTNLTPNAVVLPYSNALQLSWNYNDLVVGSDQTAYRVIVYRSDTSAVVYDSGKIASNVKSATFAPPIGIIEVPLYWTVQVWNTQDYAGAVSTSATFTLTEPAALTITSPDSTVTTGRPTFNWSVGGVNPLRTWDLKVRRQADNFLIWQANGTAGTYPVTPPYNILVNGLTYVAILSVISNAGELTSTSKTFTASYTPPTSPSFTIDASGYDSLGYVLINWAGATPASGWASWQVYRRTVDNPEWKLVYSTETVTDRTYQDWQTSTGVTYEYVVAQTAFVVDSLQQSALVSLLQTATPGVGGSWLIDPDDSSNNIRVPVLSDSFSEDVESADLVILGRGRTKEYGTIIGAAIDLTIQLHGSTAVDTFLKIRAIRNLHKNIVYRTPFGSIYQVAIGDFQWSHVAGTGTSEMYDVSLHLDEVF